jgi:hypothetical protein
VVLITQPRFVYIAFLVKSLHTNGVAGLIDGKSDIGQSTRQPGAGTVAGFHRSL